MKSPFFIACLPRSRSAWLATLLTTDTTFCLHEASLSCLYGGNFREIFSSVPHGTKIAGDADPALGLFWEELLEVFPKSRVVFVLRNRTEAARSEYEAICEDGSAMFDGVTLNTVRDRVNSMQNGLDHLWHFLPLEQKMCVGYEMLNTPLVIRDIWRFCLPGIPFQEERYRLLDNLKITQIFSKVMRKNAHKHEAFLARIPAQRAG